MFFSNFFEFLIKSLVSAENPTINFGLDLFVLPKYSKMSGFLFNSKLFNWFHDFFNLSLFLFNGFTSDTAAAHIAISTGNNFLLHSSFLHQWLP